jgi:hypothetical protein
MRKRGESLLSSSPRHSTLLTFRSHALLCSAQLVGRHRDCKRRDQWRPVATSGDIMGRKKSKDSSNSGPTREADTDMRATQTVSSYVPLSPTSDALSIVRAALESDGESFVPSRGTLDRGTLAQCLNATSQIAAECNSILRELLGGGDLGYVVSAVWWCGGVVEDLKVFAVCLSACLPVCYLLFVCVGLDAGNRGLEGRGLGKTCGSLWVR